MSIDTCDIIVPICNLHFDTKDVPQKTSELVGTAFLIGGRGYALTAGHVVDQIQEECGHVLLRNGVQWDASLVYKKEAHPHEDIGIIIFEHTRAIKSPISLTRQRILAGQDYHMWSYPLEIASEVKYFKNSEDFINFRPSIVFFRGYVRRTIYHSPNETTSIYRGNKFFEVSEIGGSCASGSPVLNPNGEVFAIYIGEEGQRCGYASVLSRVMDWTPDVLGKSIAEEAAS